MAEGDAADALRGAVDGATGELLTRLQGHHADVNALAWSPAHQLLLSAGDDGLLLAWQAALLSPRRRAAAA